MRSNKTIRLIRLSVKDWITSLSYLVVLVGMTFTPWIRRR
jgi:hypothetical protein